MTRVVGRDEVLRELGREAAPPAVPGDAPRATARVDHATVPPDAFLPGRSHYRGRPAQERPTQAPRKPPPQRVVAPVRKQPPPRVPPIAIAAVLLVAIVIAGVLLFVA